MGPPSREHTPCYAQSLGGTMPKGRGPLIRIPQLGSALRRAGVKAYAVSDVNIGLPMVQPFSSVYSGNRPTERKMTAVRRRKGR
jgi:hypothetical protein